MILSTTIVALLSPLLIFETIDKGILSLLTRSTLTELPCCSLILTIAFLTSEYFLYLSSPYEFLCISYATLYIKGNISSVTPIPCSKNTSKKD